MSSELLAEVEQTRTELENFALAYGRLIHELSPDHPDLQLVALMGANYLTYKIMAHVMRAHNPNVLEFVEDIKAMSAFEGQFSKSAEQSSSFRGSLLVQILDKLYSELKLENP